jgi:hypothetical protein
MEEQNPFQGSNTLFQEQTIPYLTFLKASVIDALRRAFALHPDPALAQTKITLEFPQTKITYPLIVIDYYGRRIFNSGVASFEELASPEVLNLGDTPQLFYMYGYEGDIEFSLYGLDTLTRDRLADSLVTLIVSQNLQQWTSNFYERIYNMSEIGIPASDYNSLTFNTDEITPFGDEQMPTPWDSENALLYKTMYRTNILGQFMTLPNSVILNDYITEILLFPIDESEGETSETQIPISVPVTADSE